MDKLLAILLLICIGCSEQLHFEETEDNDYWTEGPTLHSGDTIIYIDYQEDITRTMRLLDNKIIDFTYKPNNNE